MNKNEKKCWLIFGAYTLFAAAAMIFLATNAYGRCYPGPGCKSYTMTQCTLAHMFAQRNKKKKKTCKRKLILIIDDMDGFIGNLHHWHHLDANGWRQWEGYKLILTNRYLK